MIGDCVDVLGGIARPKPATQHQCIWKSTERREQGTNVVIDVSYHERQWQNIDVSKEHIDVFFLLNLYFYSSQWQILIQMSV